MAIPFNDSEKLRSTGSYTNSPTYTGLSSRRVQHMQIGSVPDTDVILVKDLLTGQSVDFAWPTSVYITIFFCTQRREDASVVTVFTWITQGSDCQIHHPCR